MNLITADRIVAAKLASAPRAAQWANALAAAAAEFDITTPARVAAWLAQISHESGGLTLTEENLNYSADRLVAVWPNRFRHRRPTDPADARRGSDGMALAESYAGRPADIASCAYAGRLGNGDEASRDGWRHRGMGLIQLTGRRNQMAYAAAVDAVAQIDADPSALARAPHAARSAGWFWRRAGCNVLADSEDFVAITRMINGGSIGLADRQRRWESARRVFNDDGA
jgi:putative chitinase